MLPSTEVVEASETQNSDLFWGIRGAGWNFGVVLNATFRVYDQVPNGMHMNADFVYPSNITEPFYEVLREEAKNMPAALSLASALTWNPTYNDASCPGLREDRHITDGILDNTYHQRSVCWARDRGSQGHSVFD